MSKMAIWTKVFSVKSELAGSETFRNQHDDHATRVHEAPLIEHMLVAEQYLSIAAFHVGSSSYKGAQNYCTGDPGLVMAGAEFPTSIQFWVITELGTVSSSTRIECVLGRSRHLLLQGSAGNKLSLTSQIK